MVSEFFMRCKMEMMIVGIIGSAAAGYICWRGYKSMRNSGGCGSGGCDGCCGCGGSSNKRKP